MEESQRLRKSILSSLEELVERLPLPIGLVIAEEIKSGIEEALKDVGVREVTHTHTVREVLVDRIYNFISLKGRGNVRELILTFDSTDFDLYIESDGRTIINHSFNKLMEISDVMEEIDAFEKNGVYVFRISKISFLNSLNVYVKPHTGKRVTIKEGFTLYNIF